MWGDIVNEWFGVFLATLIGFGGGCLSTFNIDNTSLKKNTGLSISEVAQQKKLCEYNLPRNRECKVVISYVTQEKK